MTDTKRWWRVTTTGWGCEVKGVIVTKQTAKTIWYEDGIWNGSVIIRKGLKHSDDYQYFPSLDDAKERAKAFIDTKIAYHERRIEDFREMRDKVEAVKHD